MCIYRKRGMEEISLTLKTSHTTPHLSSCPNQTLSGWLCLLCMSSGMQVNSRKHLFTVLASDWLRAGQEDMLWSECCTYGSNLSQHVWRGILPAPIFGLWWIEFPSGCCTLVVVEERPPHMIVKRFGCTTIHNKALYKCIIHSFIHSEKVYMCGKCIVCTVDIGNFWVNLMRVNPLPKLDTVIYCMGAFECWATINRDLSHPK